MFRFNSEIFKNRYDSYLLDNYDAKSECKKINLSESQIILVENLNI